MSWDQLFEKNLLIVKAGKCRHQKKTSHNAIRIITDSFQWANFNNEKAPYGRDYI